MRRGIIRCFSTLREANREMLDIIRRKKRLKAFLWLVIVGLTISMAVFFVPGQNLGNPGDTTIATVKKPTVWML